MRRLLAIIFVLRVNHAGGQVSLRAPTPQPAATPVPPSYRSPTELKKLPLEQVVDVPITSAARRPEPLSQAASAVDVITDEDIHRAGVTNLPDAFRLAPAMEVAQIDGHAFLPNIDHIEIIRGPGATLRGANAVNGVINIRTKSADETPGVLAYGGAGNEETGFGGIRYGGTLGDTAFRIYAMHESRDSLILSNGAEAQDDYHITQGGFRIDSKIHPDDTLTLQGDDARPEFASLPFNREVQRSVYGTLR